MSLNKSFRVAAGANIKLPQLFSVPSTEDLRFLLATAKSVKKGAEITFQNPSNGFFFLIKVIPPANQIGPKWTLERVQGGQNYALWTRESDEVMTIQNKVKMDCIYFVDGDVSEIRETGGAIVLAANNLSYNSLPAQQAVENNGFAGAFEDSAVSQPVKEYGGWMPPASARFEPPSPVYFPVAAADKLMQALCNQQTGMIRYSALIFLLMREVEYRKKNGTDFSVLVFDFVDDSGETVTFGVDELIDLKAQIADFSAPIDIFSQLQTGEFILVLSGANASCALTAAENLYKGLSGDGRSLCVGVATVSQSCEDAATLIAGAMQAKDGARKAGKIVMQFAC